jgi:hypothetical protein
MTSKLAHTSPRLRYKMFRQRDISARVVEACLLAVLLMALPVVRLDMLEHGLFEAFSGALPNASVSWGRGQPPKAQLKRDWVSLQVLSGPSPAGWAAARGVAIRPIQTATIEIADAPTENALALVTVNLQRFRYDVQSGDDADAVAVALAALVNDWLSAYGIDAVAVPADEDAETPAQLVITGTAVADLWNVRCAGVCSLGADDVGLAYVPDTQLELTSGLYAARVEVQCFSKDAVHGARLLGTEAQTALLTRQVAEALYSTYDIGLADRNAQLTDLSAIADGGWESRAAFTFGVYMRGAKARTMDVIERVNLRMVVGNKVDSFVVTVPYTL